jgi:hypothetical protein
MTPEADKTSAADKMKTVKADREKSPTGQKKDASLKHYQAAEKAHSAHDNADIHTSPDAAAKALA